MEKSRHKSFIFPIFSDYTVHVEFTSDLRKAIQKYEQTKHIELSPEADATTVQVCNCGLGFIFLPLKADVGTIAHECWHAIHHMLSYFGVELDSEVVAYHLGYMVNQVFEFQRGRKS